MTQFKTLAVAAVTAFGISLTPVPAVADGRDVAKVIGGLAVLGIIAKVIDDRNDRNDSAVVSSQGQFRAAPVINNRSNVTTRTLRRTDRDRVNTRRAQFKRRALPDRCLRTVDTRRGDRFVYVQRCLNSNFQFASRLPDHCQTSIRTNRGFRSVYGARCLSRDGWRVSTR
ncbi:hypothetical protein N9L47_03695 [Rhodobacteraceae bacterium]|nr:hypothetical protein [Paracoccaceae bacterium]